MKAPLALLLAASLFSGFAALRAEDAPPTPPSDTDTPQPSNGHGRNKIYNSLNFRQGSFPIGGDVATLKLSDKYQYLDPADTNKVLHDLWGNPPSNTLGSFGPKKNSRGQVDWLVIIDGFEKEGYVKDEDAEKIDADKLLKQLQDEQKEANEHRKQEGYNELEIVGWAVPPHYDKENKKLYWAFDLRDLATDRHSVNYYIRVLGRRGYFVIDALCGKDELAEVEAVTPEFLPMIEFNEGHRYADFNPSTDKVATYGIVGLIAGAVGLKVAAKLGLLALLLKKIGVIALALKKLWIVIIGGFAALGKKIAGLFSRKKESPMSKLPPSTDQQWPN